MFESGDNEKVNVPKSGAESSLQETLELEELQAIEETGADKQHVPKNRELDDDNPMPSQKFFAWADHHVQSAFDSLHRMLASPASSIMTWMVIGIALALPSILFVVLNNVERIGERWDSGTRVSLFLMQSVNAEQAEILAEKIARRSDISKAEFVSKDDALTFFKHHSGLGEALHNLDENPFPPSIEIQYKDQLEPSKVTKLLEQLQRLKGVDSVQLDLEWVQRLYKLMQLGKRLTLILICLLSLGVLLVVGNTVRLAIENRRHEIVVVKLVGGTNSFVRRPFLYSGFWYGLAGGLIALAIIALTLWVVSGPVNSLMSSYDSNFELLKLTVSDALGLLTCGVLLGWLGSWLAVSYHLIEIEP